MSVSVSIGGDVMGESERLRPLVWCLFMVLSSVELLYDSGVVADILHCTTVKTKLRLYLINL